MLQQLLLHLLPHAQLIQRLETLAFLRRQFDDHAFAGLDALARHRADELGLGLLVLDLELALLADPPLFELQSGQRFQHRQHAVAGGPVPRVDGVPEAVDHVLGRHRVAGIVQHDPIGPFDQGVVQEFLDRHDLLDLPGGDFALLNLRACSAEGIQLDRRPDDFLSSS